MTSHAEVDQSGHRTRELPGVSGTVVHVLIDLVRRRAGEIGVAQALALADDHRPFSDLDDFEEWSTFEEGVRLFNAAALVTGDEAIGLHVGERLLSTPDGSDFADRIRAVGLAGAGIRRSRRGAQPLRDHFGGGGARGRG